MANRSKRALIAKQTLEIVKRGGYELPNGTNVSIADAVERAVTDTVHYAPGDFATISEQREVTVRENATSDAPRFRVSNETTLAAARELVAADPTRSVLALNFASAKNPGGGFLGGSQAQEESLARASALYACISPKQEYYTTNRACGTCLYTDHMIHSPAVPVFRDDDDELLAEPYEVSFITAPAANAGAMSRNETRNVDKIPDVMLGRIEKLLSLAVVHGHCSLVLGAWGCGVFRNDPAEVADWFHHWLCQSDAFRGSFNTVVFAVLDRTTNLDIIRPFQQRFA